MPEIQHNPVEDKITLHRQFSQSTKTKNGAVTYLLVVLKEEQHQSLHYMTEFSPGILCCRFPEIVITETHSPKQQRRYAMILSPMVLPQKTRVRHRAPGLMKLLLTVQHFWSWVPLLQLRLGDSD